MGTTEMNDHIEVLRGLVGKWRVPSPGDECTLYSMGQRSGRYACADELDAALAALSAQAEAQNQPRDKGPCRQCGDTGMVDSDAEGFSVGMVPCPRCPPQQPEAQTGGEVPWRPMDTAPRDGTMLRLLVRFTEHATEDAEIAPTIGAWPADGDHDGAWQFAGWCWTHDHFTEGKGEPIGWLPLLDPTPPPGAVLSADGSLTYAGQRRVVEHMMVEIRDAIALMQRIQQRAEAIDCQPTTPPPGAVPEGVVRVEVAVVSELMDALHSFAATAEDDESYTVSSELMSRLAMLGAVYRAKRVGWYYLTDFGRMLLAAAPGPKEGV